MYRLNTGYFSLKSNIDRGTPISHGTRNPIIGVGDKTNRSRVQLLPSLLVQIILSVHYLSCASGRSSGMSKITNPEVAAAFERYPSAMRRKLMTLRQLILDTAAESEDVGPLEETLKWGEPSYLAKGGSAVRMGWKKSQPDFYALYFHCQTRLVDTFKELYRDEFKFEGNRAIVFDKNDGLPVEALKHCIYLSLTYHRRKHLPMLGA